MEIVEQHLDDYDFDRLSSFVHEQTGIMMPRVKKTMLQARLQKRLRMLGLKSFKDYCSYLFGPHGAEEEVGNFINAVTTNKTDFFREPNHFDFLIQTALPLLQQNGLIRQRHIQVWSTACSSGPEPYTLAMVLADYTDAAKDLSWSVFATDISTKVLNIAEQAIYPEEDVLPVPLAMRKKYLLRSKNPDRKAVKIVSSLRTHVEFKRLNLMSEYYDIPSRFEIIFCRNVIIYFDRPTQLLLLQRIVNRLAPGGYLFLGHSESIYGFPLALTAVSSTVYQKPLDSK
jgi:chemotaxis protein methyltransferase CheR